MGDRIAFTSPQQPSVAEIAVFERWLGHGLPNPYRGMLLSQGAGHPAVFTLVDPGQKRLNFVQGHLREEPTADARTQHKYFEFTGPL